ncbi:metal-sulfur cluster assembly factor [Alicyclobacillus tolerans]|uniref:metal-sulfur cluster assembly factor n=1 Tax=Alicyclobacillus tolerans TaxID=90970 RepID=UPI001F356938|nr:metal-sulfur cluster assembly factor [Alicyclobacillus tolerans]MCF8566380.1 metal-sulfur cluster assembly factor [Alicyclobacillus tolerans]
MINVEEVRQALTGVLDPELGLNVIELGLVYEINEVAEGDLVIKMTMTTPGCPMHDNISDAVDWAVMHVDNVASVKVDVVWDPPWSPDMMTDDAKAKLGF